MSSLYKTLGDRVRTLRKEARLSQEELAELVKTDVRTIVAIEAGSRNPTLKTINKIANALRVKIKDLVTF